MKYAFIVDGLVASIRESDALPEGAVELSDEDYQAIAADISGNWRYSNDTATRVTIEPALAAVKLTKIEEMNRACAAQIQAGFISDALGEPHRYPAKQTDQLNLMASVLDSLLPGLPTDWSTPFWCANAAAEWSWARHSKVEIQMVGQHGKASVLAAIETKQTLLQQIDVAANTELVSAISWPQTV